IASALEHTNVNGRSVAVQAENELPLIPFDFALIEQVLLNLLENAIKYSPAGTPLTLSADARDGSMVITVADRGPSIPREDLERVFDKFYRAGNTGVPGTGLGLTICKGIVQAHGGTICARARQGGGTEICFTLPLS
ncbi:MAG: sensor histidine kinase, partial [Rudaea sp.]